MRDVYLYENCGVLKNPLHIKDKMLLDEAEADYVTYALSISISLSGVLVSKWAGNYIAISPISQILRLL